MQNKITAAGETMQTSLDLADKRFTEFEGLRKQKLGQVSAEFATLSVNVESLSQVMDRINAVEETNLKADKVVENIRQSLHQMNIDYDRFKVGMSQTFQTIKREVLTELQSTRHSLSKAIAVSSQTAGGSSKGPQTTMDADKRLVGWQQISGFETSAVITEWYRKAFIKIESAVYPALEWYLNGRKNKVRRPTPRSLTIKGMKIHSQRTGTIENSSVGRLAVSSARHGRMPSQWMLRAVLKPGSKFDRT